VLIWSMPSSFYWNSNKRAQVPRIWVVRSTMTTLLTERKHHR